MGVSGFIFKLIRWLLSVTDFNEVDCANKNYYYVENCTTLSNTTFHSAEEIFLESNKFTDIPAFIFQNFDRVQKMDLKRNRLVRGKFLTCLKMGKNPRQVWLLSFVFGLRLFSSFKHRGYLPPVIEVAGR